MAFDCIRTEALRLARTNRDIPRNVAFWLPERPGFGQRSDAGIVIAERLAQHRSGVLAEQGRCDRIDHRRQFHAERRFDIGDRACGRVRNLAEAMTLATAGSVPNIETPLRMELT